MAEIQFWYSLVSPYAYLTAMRIDELVRGMSISVVHQPMALLPIYKRLGWRVNPFADFPYKLDYVWRDVERLSEHYGVRFVKPNSFPQDAIPATKVALLGCAEGWVWEFSKRVFRANFQDGVDIASARNLVSILNDMELPGKDIVRASAVSDVADRLQGQTERAISQGVFGAPFFLVDGERFWGNDRLEQALDWARS